MPARNGAGGVGAIERRSSAAAPQHPDGVLALVPGCETEAVEDLAAVHPPRGGIPLSELSSQLVPLLDPQSLPSLFGVIPS